MKKKGNILVILLVIIFLVALVPAGYFYFQTNQLQNLKIKNVQTTVTTSGVKVPNAIPDYSISRLNNDKSSSGTYMTSGYIVKIYSCPPCPTGSLCKTCMKDNIVISEKNKRIESYNDVKNTELVIFTENLNKLELGKQYSFTVKILNQNTTGGGLNDLELVKADVLLY